jgi:HK97 family phage prohead protease
VNTLTLPDLDVVRNWHSSVAFRADDDESDGAGDEGLGLMDVRFSTFDTWYEINSWWEGRFLERTVRGAFKRTIAAHNKARNADAHQIITLFNHGMDFHIGDKILGSIESLSEEPDSPLSVVRLFDTSFNRDLLPGLRAGVYGSSFMFRVVKDEWNNEPGVSEHNPEGLPERTLKELRVFEAGPVTFPANPDATAGMRCTSGTDTYYEQLARRDPNRVDGLRSKLTALRAAGPGLANGTPGGRGPATEPPSDPALRHSDGLAFAHQRRRYLDMLTKENA